MAEGLGQSDQALQQFVNQSPWSADVLLEALAKETGRSPSDYWIITGHGDVPETNKAALGQALREAGFYPHEKDDFPMGATVQPQTRLS